MYEYRLEQEQENIGLLIFVAPGVQINVYYSKRTVATCLDHPTKGRTQMFRRNVSEAELIRSALRARVAAASSTRPTVPLTSAGLGDPTFAERVDELLAGFGGEASMKSGAE